MEITEKKGYIFDVDGTLYNQPQMRLTMLLTLLFYYLLHMWKLKELLAVYYFRKYREATDNRALDMNGLYDLVSKRLHINAQTVEKTVQKWMFEVPLNIIQDCAYDEVIAFAHKMHSEGKTIIIYSDYPAEEKLLRLDMPNDHIFVSGSEHLPEVKPCATAMHHILEVTQFSSKDLVFIGDRSEKDGESAKLVNMEYCDIRSLRTYLQK